MSLTVAMVLRSGGGVFTPLWVERLVRQVRKHLNPDHIVCLSDLELFPSMDPLRVSSLRHDWPGWFAKLELFRPGLFSGATIYFDLDTAIVGPIPRLGETIVHENRLLLLDDFFRPNLAATGVMAWMPSPQTERIYHDFVHNPRIRSGWSNGDGSLIGAYEHSRLQHVFPGVFGSLKAHRLDRGPIGFKVICQHGRPKFHELPDSHWMYRHWIAEPTAPMCREADSKSND